MAAAIHESDIGQMSAFVYFMTNRPNGTLHVGVTDDIQRRALEHRRGEVDGFTRRYGLKRLVYYEAHQSISTAIQREKTIKHWPRAWKVRLILKANPEWDDLFEGLPFAGAKRRGWPG